MCIHCLLKTFSKYFNRRHSVLLAGRWWLPFMCFIWIMANLLRVYMSCCVKRSGYVLRCLIWDRGIASSSLYDNIVEIIFFPLIVVPFKLWFPPSWNIFRLFYIFGFSNLVFDDTDTNILRVSVKWRSSGCEITPCNKLFIIDQPLVVYRFSRKDVTCKQRWVHNDKFITFLWQICQISK